MFLRIAFIAIYIFVSTSASSIESVKDDISLEKMILENELLDDINSNRNEEYEDVVANITSFDLQVRFLGTSSQSARETLKKADEFLEADDFDSAEELYKQIINSYKGFQRAFMGLGHLYYLKRNYQMAVEIYTSLLKIQKKMHPLTLSAMIVAMENYDPEKALIYAEQLSNRRWRNAHIFAQHAGLIAANLNMLPKAQKFLAKSIVLNGKNPVYFYNMAVVFDKQNNKHAALYYYSEFLRKIDELSVVAYSEQVNTARQRIILLS